MTSPVRVAFNVVETAKSAQAISTVGSLQHYSYSYFLEVKTSETCYLSYQGLTSTYGLFSTIPSALQDDIRGLCWDIYPAELAAVLSWMQRINVLLQLSVKSIINGRLIL